MNDAKLVLLDRFLDNTQAQIVRGLLESNGIECTLFDTHQSALNMGPVLGGVRLMVPENQYHLAEKILKDLEIKK